MTASIEKPQWNQPQHLLANVRVAADDCSQQSSSLMQGVNLGDECGAIAGDQLGSDYVR